MKKVSATKFKAHCFAIMEEVRSSGKPVTITERGVPLVRMEPVRSPNADVFGCMEGRTTIVGDIESPIPVRWEPV